jgi:hypothetical protein
VASIDTPLETQPPAKGRNTMPSDKSSNKEPETPKSPDGKSKQSTDDSSDYLITPDGYRSERMTTATLEELGMGQDTFVSFTPRKKPGKQPDSN